MIAIHVRPSTQRSGTCRGCSARLIWVQTLADKWMPLNADAPLPKGAEPVVQLDASYAHWATCPHRAAFDRRKR